MTLLDIQPAIVVVDTGIFSAVVAGPRAPLYAKYLPHLSGRRLTISFQTVAEVRYGAIKGNWGQRRILDLENRIRQVAPIPVDTGLSATYAELKARCERQGHGLGQKIHDGDRWIAATAIHYGYPLVADDRIFMDVPGLQLITNQTADAATPVV